MLSRWPLVKGAKIIRYQRVVGPAFEPISFELQKAALKVGNLNTNAYTLQNKIATARATVEKKINRCLVAQIFDAFLDDEAIIATQPSYTPWARGGFGFEFDCNGLPEIVLSYPPVRHVIGVYTTDESNVETEVSRAIYNVTRSKEPARIRVNPGQQWPRHRGYESFRIRFAAGYMAPFTVDPDGSINCPWHGLRSGDYLQFCSWDNTLPAPLTPMATYMAVNLNGHKFQVNDINGNLVTPSAEWSGTGFVGEVPSPILTSMVLISGLNQAGEIHARVPGGGNSRLNPIELPVDPYELLEPYIWTDHIGNDF